MKKVLIVILFLLLIGGGGYWLYTSQIGRLIPANQNNVNTPQQGAQASTGTQQSDQSGLPSIGEQPVLSPSSTDAGNIAEPISAAPPTTTADAGTKSALPTVTYVEIVNHAFTPISITVKQGTVIKWTNDDTAPHTVTADGGDFGSPTLNQTDGFTFTFNQPGTYPYHCSIHPDMHGTVTVTQ